VRVMTYTKFGLCPELNCESRLSSSAHLCNILILECINHSFVWFVKFDMFMSSWVWWTISDTRPTLMFSLLSALTPQTWWGKQKESKAKLMPSFSQDSHPTLVCLWWNKKLPINRLVMHESLICFVVLGFGP